MGGSILPITVHNGQILFLFGKERDIDENPGWSDFGGGTDKGETFIDTASREGGEELTGFLGSSADIRKMLKKNGSFIVDYKSTEGYSTYRVHILPVEYDPFLVYYYNNNQRFIQTHLDPKIISDTKIFEKPQIKWWTFSEIKKGRNQFRSFYKNIVDLILKDQPEISAFAFKKLKSKQTKKRRNRRQRYTNKTKRK